MTEQEYRDVVPAEEEQQNQMAAEEEQEEQEAGEEVEAEEGEGEEQEEEELQEEIDNLEDRISKVKQVREKEKKEVSKEVKEENKKRENESKEEYREVYEKFLRRGMSDLNREERNTIREKRAQNVANSSKGGYLVPETWASEMIEKLEETNIMRRLATVETTAVETNIPVDVSKPQFAWIDEEGSFPETESEFGNRSVDAWKNGGIIKVSEELLFDNQYDLEGKIERDFGDAASDIGEEAFIAGDGVKKPRGIILDAQAGVSDAGGSSNVSFDDVIDLIYSLGRQYRRNAAFLVNDDAAKTLRKLKDNNDQYLWQPSTQQGEPDMLLGYAINYSPEMPDISDNNKALLFGDFSYYLIMDREGMFMQRLEEKYANTGQIGFRAYMRTDGMLTLPEAVKYLDVGSA